MLPQYYYVERDSNDPRWETIVMKHFRDLDPDKRNIWKGDHKFYGFDGSLRYGGTMAYDVAENFDNDLVKLTIDEFCSMLPPQYPVPQHYPDFPGEITW